MLLCCPVSPCLCICPVAGGYMMLLAQGGWEKCIYTLLSEVHVFSVVVTC